MQIVVAVIPGMVLKHRKHLIAQFLIEPRCLEVVGVEEHVSAYVGCVSIVKGPMSMDDAPPRDCVPSLLRILCCHIPRSVVVACYTGEDFKPAKRVPARERTYWMGGGRRCRRAREGHHG